ncbi:erythroid differentiation-related factor 1 isoform X2 [Condylostylus longicornis]|uniref:erythroid differentiation-related factor 1 isoform X2 n=1 Tax=Condylostylus longicornis TaxID=2530218 RepID=UPI00244DDD52|nr:erythroid differentiation-related factor 1 isoform X2 [Condylostylus longicornis]
MEDDSSEQIETRKIEHDQNPKSDSAIKSNAVVKYSNVQAPAKLKLLDYNTNLNMPPSNWLCTTGTQYGIYPLHGPVGFASFKMAHMFSDCLEDVDVVSDAENIKTLLKLPYSPKTVISMLVHKVGNTLLLDEFDIQKYLLRKSENDWNWLHTFINEKLKKIGGDKTRNICIKDKSREAVHRRNLLSKFLYYTLQHSLPVNVDENAEEIIEKESNAPFQNRRPLLPLLGPVLPEPNIEENVPDPNSSHVFNRNIVWTFEDIRMLIGTDMPIFGGGTRPCVSLRLRDMTQPINILTGIDYWLDNLMCNVPEVVMCYHIDGIVQKYELIKTEDLPFLEDSQFSPQIIRNVAQNILAFLKANATKAGHTYWLFKGKNDDVVKLYDLTTLCESDKGAKGGVDPEKDKNLNSEENMPHRKNENPFTVSVAMLLYSVARNLRNASEKITAKKAGSIKALLENCLKLLPKEKYPQIVTSSHYMLADLHIPAGVNPKCPNFHDCDSDTQSSVYEDDYEYEDNDENDNCEYFQNSEANENVTIINNSNIFKEISIKETVNRGNFSDEKYSSETRPSPLLATLDERCKISLEHISEGLSCLQYFSTNEEHINQELAERLKAEEKRKIIHEEQNPHMAKPFQPIPLPYESLKPEPKMTNPDIAIPMGWENSESKNGEIESNKKIFGKKKKGKMAKQNISEEKPESVTANSKQKLIESSSQTQNKRVTSWNVHLKFLLLEKACLTFVIQAESSYSQEEFGICLKCIEFAFKCQGVELLSSISNQKASILERAGDCFFQIVKYYDQIDKYLEQFLNYYNGCYEYILRELTKESTNSTTTALDFEPVKSIEQLMVKSCDFYESALKFSMNEEIKYDLMRKLGSVRNELGLKYMYCAQEEYTKYMEKYDSEAEKGVESDKNEEPKYQLLAKQSFDNLIRGICAFEKVHDNVNLAFLLCNMGRFMRFRAHIHMKGEEPNDMRNQKRFYHQAFSYYQRALGILDNRKLNPELWDMVNWDLSTATFTLAKQVQDWSSAESPSEEVEKEIVELLQKSLKLCDTEHPGSRQVLYTYRSGLIHQRLGSFYHSQLRKLGKSFDENISKTSLQLCRLHYEKSAKILQNLKEIKDYLTVQLERIALQEFLSEVSNKVNKKMKFLQGALEICLQTKTVFMHVIINDIEINSKDEILKLFNLFLSRLQFLLKTLTKLNMGKNANNNKNSIGNKEMKKYADMYNVSINTKSNENHKDFARNIINCLDKINEVFKI